MDLKVCLYLTFYGYFYIKIILFILGISPLIALPDFDVINGFAIDYMHAVLLGIVRKLISLWFDQRNFKQNWYIRKHIEEINKRIQTMNLPSEIQRRPRSLNERNNWKANELRSWLLIYSVGALFEFLPIEYLNNYMQLVAAISIYLQSNISEIDLKNAREYIYKFLMEYEQLYGKENMLYNFHTISHLPDCVANLGPIWSYSNFPFENNNGKLVSYVLSPTAVLNQICSKYDLRRYIVYSNFDIQVLKFQNSMSKTNHLLTSLTAPKILGVGTLYNFNNSSFLSYNRVSIKNVMFATFDYCINKKCDDSVVKLSKSNVYGRIVKILTNNDNIYFLINTIKVNASHFDIDCLNYLKIVESDNSKQLLVSVNDVDSKCILCDFGKLIYIVKFDCFVDKD